jgi:hypothetical protein
MQELPKNVSHLISGRNAAANNVAATGVENANLTLIVS